MRRRTKIVSLAAVALLVATVRVVDETPKSGPLVYGVTSSAARIVVVRPAPATGTAKLTRQTPGDDGAAQPKVVQVEASTTRLVFKFDGLDPACAYDYELSLREGDVQTHMAGCLRTAPPEGTGKVRFAAFGDSGKIPWWTYASAKVSLGPAPWLEDLLPGRGYQWELAQGIVNNQVDLVLHLGDVCYPKGRREHYNEAYFEPFANLAAQVPVWATIGNHDDITEQAQPLIDYFDLGSRYYDFVYGPVHFVCIDVYSSAIDAKSKQRQWLATTLQKKVAPWIVVFLHRPFHTVSRSKDDADNALLRNEVHPLLREAGVRLVLSGHDHNYQRFAPIDGIHYVVAGGGGKSLYELGESSELAFSLREYGFVVVDADDRVMRLVAHDIDGSVVDRVDITR